MGMLEGMLRDRFLCDRLGFPANFDLKQLAVLLTLALGCFCLPAKEALAAVPAVGA